MYIGTIIIIESIFRSNYTLLEEKKCNLEPAWNPFCPVFIEPSGGKGSQKGSLHVQEPKKVPYI